MIVSKYRKNYFIFITCITLCIFFEIISFFIFKVTNEDKKINLYSEKRSSNLNYQYFPSVKLALPKANASIVHYTQEFTDRFITKDILNMGFGLFDDGINFEKEIISVAIGDSFTRGTGSKDNLKNGWVELVEKKSKKIDIINLGNLGKGIIDQKYGYDLIKKFIKHDVIIYNFFTGGDYHENGIDTSASYFLNHSIENNNLKRVVYIGNPSSEALSAVFSLCDIGLSMYVKDSTVTMPIKAFHYFAAGLAVINSLEGDLSSLLLEHNAGIQYEAEDSQSLVNALGVLVSDKNMRERMAKNSFELAGDFDEQIQYKKAAQLVERVAQKNK